jgi:hypothetical protein
LPGNHHRRVQPQIPKGWPPPIILLHLININVICVG